MTRLLLAVLVLSSAPAAQAASDSTSGKTSAAALIGWGIGFDSTNEYGFGFGARAGYTFPFQLYAGGSFIYYIGSSVGAGANSATVNVWTLAGEVGYELVAGPVEIRPFLGVGFGDAKVGYSLFGTSGSNSVVYFALMPGAVATFNFNGPGSTGPFVGADVHLTWLPAASGANAVSLLATGGYRF